MNMRFIKLGAPNRGERVSKFNRLLQIESELEANGKLAPQVDHEFKHMALPDSEEAEGAPTSPVSPKKEEGKKEGKKKWSFVSQTVKQQRGHLFCSKEKEKMKDCGEVWLGRGKGVEGCDPLRQLFWDRLQEICAWRTCCFSAIQLLWSRLWSEYGTTYGVVILYDSLFYLHCRRSEHGEVIISQQLTELLVCCCFCVCFVFVCLGLFGGFLGCFVCVGGGGGGESLYSLLLWKAVLTVLVSVPPLRGIPLYSCCKKLVLFWICFLYSFWQVHWQAGFVNVVIWAVCQCCVMWAVCQCHGQLVSVVTWAFWYGLISWMPRTVRL